MLKRTEEILREDTPPSTPASSQRGSRRSLASRNRRILRVENRFLKNKVYQLENVVSKYKMSCRRLKQQHLKPIIADIKNNISDLKKMHFLSDGPTT